MSRTLKVVVTGGSGYIGGFVIKELLDRGHQVINIDRRQAKAPLARFVYADLRRRELIQPIFEGVDAVCHLGEIPNWEVPMPPDEVYSHNTAVGSCVMQTAADLSVPRVIYSSTAQVYGAWGRPFQPPVSLPVDESHPLRGYNVYSLSKICNEQYARLLSEKSGISIAIFRFPWVIGRDRDGDNMFRWLGTRNELQQDGMATYIHVTDLARGYALAVENARPGCHAYNFSGTDIASPRPLKETITATGLAFPLLPSDWPDYKSPLLTDKARDHFGWEPTWCFREKYAEWQAKQTVCT